jgi:putative hemolysin
MTLSRRSIAAERLIKERDAAAEESPVSIDPHGMLQKTQHPIIAEWPLVSGAYRVRFAETQQELESVFRLRFLVFNLELREGLESSYESGRDIDPFDGVCDHLIVEHGATSEVVGTYRLQSGSVAASNLGYYSAREFEFSPYEPLRDSLIELGRASIHRDHRSFEVLTLLWRGIARYALSRSARYLVGCSSITSQDTREGSAMYWRLRDYLAEPAFQTKPREEFSFPVLQDAEAAQDAHPPRLLRAYLSIGARICGPPAIDRDFKTIDFLTLLDLDRMPQVVRARFLE